MENVTHKPLDQSIRDFAAPLAKGQVKELESGYCRIDLDMKGRIGDDFCKIEANSNRRTMSGFAALTSMVALAVFSGPIALCTTVAFSAGYLYLLAQWCWMRDNASLSSQSEELDSGIRIHRGELLTEKNNCHSLFLKLAERVPTEATNYEYDPEKLVIDEFAEITEIEASTLRDLLNDNERIFRQEHKYLTDQINRAKKAIEDTKPYFLRLFASSNAELLGQASGLMNEGALDIALDICDLAKLADLKRGQVRVQTAEAQ